MVCKVYFFNLSECEKIYLENKNFDNFDISYFDWDLSENTLNQLNQDEFPTVMMISVNENSHVSSEVINKFKNLRLISTRTQNVNHIDINTCFNNNIAIVNVENFGDCAENLKTTFAGMSSYLCGCKDYRIL